MLSIILFTSFAVFLLIGTPIAICLGMSSIFTIIADAGTRPLDTVMSVVPMLVSSSSSKFVLLAIPFFILSGNIMEKAGISEKLIRLAEVCVGHITGGLAIICVVVACFFAAISGSGPATVAALGMIIIPAMVFAGYNSAFSSALMAAASAIGVIIPPSITFVIFGSITDTSIGSLFIAGLLPGIIMGAGLLVVALWKGRKMKLEVMNKATSRERWLAFKDAIWGLMMPVIILGGIYGGIFTPTESAAVAVVYGLFVGVFIYKKIHFKEFCHLLIDSASTTAVVMFITAAATIFAYVLTRAKLNITIGDAIYNFTGDSTILFLILVNIVFLIAGCFLDSTSALYIFVPLFMPVALNLGIDPIHFGVVIIVNLAIGLFTPPVGMNLYVACGLGKVSLKKLSMAIIPFVIVSLLILLIVTYIPQISLIFI